MVGDKAKMNVLFINVKKLNQSKTIHGHGMVAIMCIVENRSKCFARVLFDLKIIYW